MRSYNFFTARPIKKTGLFYGDPGQLVAQLVGVATLLGIIFTLSYVLNVVVDIVVGQRVSAEGELAGLDIPELGALGYPEFVLKTYQEAHSGVGQMASA